MITLDNLCFSYTSKKQLFHNLNMRLEKGHIYGLLGKNGAGKSTLIKTMVGLAFPTSGRCTINNEDAGKRNASLLADLYLLSEDFHVPAISPSVYAKRTGVFYPNFSIEDFRSNLKALDIDPEENMARQSFGQQKKAMIAFGLATNTSLLIMDEPTNGLDIPSKTVFRKLIAAAYNEERCFIISTHQVKDLETLIDTLIVLDDQKIVLHQSIDDLTEKLTFSNNTNIKTEDVIFDEKGMSGNRTISKNTNGEYGKVDLELLFNAITSSANSITDHLNKS